MTINSNLYDIDSELLRDSENVEELSIEEAQNRIKSYQEKLNKLAKEDPKNPKLSVYNTYIKNLQSYVFNQYLLHPELMPHLNPTTQDEIAKAMDDLKNEVDNETVMDEYVQFDELPASDGAPKEPIEEIHG